MMWPFGKRRQMSVRRSWLSAPRLLTCPFVAAPPLWASSVCVRAARARAWKRPPSQTCPSARHVARLSAPSWTRARSGLVQDSCRRSSSRHIDRRPPPSTPWACLLCADTPHRSRVCALRSDDCIRDLLRLHVLCAACYSTVCAVFVRVRRMQPHTARSRHISDALSITLSRARAECDSESFVSDQLLHILSILTSWEAPVVPSLYPAGLLPECPRG